MAIKKCPHCGLNYIKSTESVCSICLDAMNGAIEIDDYEDEMCVRCGERPAMEGKELCEKCYREEKHRENNENIDDNENVITSEIDEIDDVEEIDGIDGVSEFDIDDVGNEDIPENELKEINNSFDEDDEEYSENDMSSNENIEDF